MAEEVINSRLDDLEYQLDRTNARLRVQDYVNREIMAALFRNQIEIVWKGFKKASDFKTDTATIMTELMKIQNFTKVTNLASAIIIDAKDMRSPKQVVNEVQGILDGNGMKEKLMILAPTQINQTIVKAANNTIKCAIFETIQYTLNNTGHINELVLRHARKKVTQDLSLIHI